MALKVAPEIQAELDAGNGVSFELTFESESAFNVLEFRQDGHVVAVDNHVGEETYQLPPGDYAAEVMYWGAPGTEGMLLAPGHWAHSGKIKEGRVRASLRRTFTL